MKSIKDSDILKNAGIEFLGKRICPECDAEVPIYKRNGQEYSLCLKCENKKISQKETNGYEPPKRRELTNKVRAIQYIPSELSYVTFDDYIPKTESQKLAKQLAYEFIEGKHNSLLFQGDPGTGKSHLFRCAARELEKQKIPWKETNWEGKEITYKVNKTVLFAKVPELMKLIQSTYKRDSTLSEDAILQTINDVDVLVLDEIAGERSKKEDGFETWSGDILYQILDHRQDKANLYNLNYPSSEVKQKYGETHGKRILSRMSAKARILKLDGPDHRMKGLE